MYGHAGAGGTLLIVLGRIEMEELKKKLKELALLIVLGRIEIDLPTSSIIVKGSINRTR